MWTLLLFGALICGMQTSAEGATLTLSPDRTLSGGQLTVTPLKMTLTTDADTLSVDFTAPYYAGEMATNRVHLFVADQSHKITELEFSPTDSTVLRMYWAPFNVLKSVSSSDDQPSLTASVTVSDDGKTWAGTASVHRDLLPPRISLVNAANVHPKSTIDNELQYDNLYAITNSGIAMPDLMVLNRYKAIGPRFLFDNEEVYSKEWNV